MWILVGTVLERTTGPFQKNNSVLIDAGQGGLARQEKESHGCGKTTKTYDH